MENFYLKSTSKTPHLEFRYNEALFEIKGRSIPENSIEFYKPLINYIEDYLTNPKPKTTVAVKLEYFNTSSSKCLVEVFRKLEKVLQFGFEIKILWYYESDDEDMLESGEDFKEILKIPIELVRVEQTR